MLTSFTSNGKSYNDFQAQFSQSRMVYGIVTLGIKSDRGDSYFVKTFQLRSSEQKNCDGMVIYGGTNTVNM